MSVPKIQFSTSVDSETSSIHSMAMEKFDKLDLVDGELIDTDDLHLLERYVFTAINEGNMDTLHQIFNDFSNTTAILQLLVTIAYPNDDGFYGHDPEVEKDAEELLGLK